MNDDKNDAGTPARDGIDPAALFDQEYYQHHCGPVPYEREESVWKNHFGTVARNIVDNFSPKTTLDVGSAKGFLVEQLRDLGVEAYGIDASPFAISEVREDIRPHCEVRSATEPFGRKYDLITCIEVIEHMPEEDAAKVVENLCKHADEVLFSSTPDDYEEPTHFNIQPPEYWKELFARQGFYPVLRNEPKYVTDCAVVFRKVHQKLKVVVLSREREEWAVVRLRILDPLRELQRQDRLELTFVSTYDDAVDVETMLDADIWVVQREFADKSLSTGVFEAAKKIGKTVVFEIDDLLINLPRSNPLSSYCQKITPDLLACVRDADFVTASTRPLIDELHKEEPTVNEKAFVRRNVVDTTIWGGEYRERKPLPGEPIVVGWFGSATHEDDLAIVKPAIQYLSRKHEGKVVFHFWGYLPEDLKAIPGVRLARGPQANVVKHAKGVRDARIDIAIAPLTDHVFNRAKSDLKWLEYSICGIPGIYSNVAPYQDEIISGIDGVVVDNTTMAWVEAIEALIEDEELRLQLGRQAFERVRGEFCVDSRAMEWDDLYRSFVATGPREDVGELEDGAVAHAASLLFEFQGRQQARNGRLVDAVRSFEASLDLDPERVETVLRVAIGLSSKGCLAAAERLLVAATRRVPNNADGHLWLAKFYRSVGDTVRSEAALDAARRLHPADPDLAKEHVEHLRDTGQEERVAERLAAVVAAELVPEEAVQVAEMLVKMGRPRDARAVAMRASEAFPTVDFQPLVGALEKAAEAQSTREAAVVTANLDATPPLSVAVYALQPISGARIQTRIAGPMSVLENASMTEVFYSDGRANADAVERAEVVVIHREFASADSCGRIIERAREAGKAVVYDLDDLWFERLKLSGDPRADEARRDAMTMIGAADATIVTTSLMAEALSVMVPEARERIAVIEPMFDVGAWPSTNLWTPSANRPLHVGIFSGWSRPAEAREIVSAMAPIVRAAGGKVRLTSWTPNFEGSKLPSSPNVGAATPFYREYARALQASNLDLALVPTSGDLYHGTLGDQIWLDLAACRVPGLFSARDPFVSSVIPGKTGFLVEDDPQQWAELTLKLLEAPDVRRDVVDRAWTIAFGERSMQQNAAAWYDLYVELARGQRDAAPVAEHEAIGAGV